MSGTKLTNCLLRDRVRPAIVPKHLVGKTDDFMALDIAHLQLLTYVCISYNLFNTYVKTYQLRTNA